MSNEEPSAEAVALLDSVPCGLLRISESGTILRANRTFCAWIGYDADALVGRLRFQDLLTMGARIFLQTHWTPLLSLQGSVSEVKLELFHRGGGTVPMVINACMRDEAGIVTYDLAAFVARDRDRYEQELVLSRKRLEVLVAESTKLQSEAKDRAVLAEQMIGIVSHDLRNPLTGIAMGAAVLAHGELSPDQGDVVARIARGAERAHRLIADLLDFTQARLGKGLPITREPIDVHAVVAESVDEIGHLHPTRAIVHVRRGDALCFADPSRLAQLVGNLVSNALAYGTPGTPVTVTSSIGAADFGIEVHNEGAPIPAAVQEHLFQPMTRGEQPVSGARSVGLGLFIVREIARAHGGRTTVRSAPGEGTTFGAVFPRT